MRSVKKSKNASAMRKQRIAPEDEGGMGGAPTGGAIGAVAGPSGAVRSAMVGGFAGAMASAALDNAASRKMARSHELDAQIGVSGGELGAPSPDHSPVNFGSHSAAALGLNSPVPPLIWRAIQLAAGDEIAVSIACQLFVDDMSDSCPKDQGPAARLEHAVARTTLDAWRRGQGSCESVGSAYAAAGDGVTRARAGMSGRGESSRTLSASDTGSVSRLRWTGARYSSSS
jgi:hypothetical protein